MRWRNLSDLFHDLAEWLHHPWDFSCTKTAQVRDLSDHYPVIGRFEYAD